MTRLAAALIAALALATPPRSDPLAGTTSQHDRWRSLFDGTTTGGWRG